MKAINFDSLMEYQKADMQLKKLRSELKKCPAAIKMRESSKTFDAAKARLSACEERALKVCEVYNNCKNYLSENNEKFTGVAELGEAASEDEIKESNRVFDSYKNRFMNAEKKLNDCQDEANRVLKEYKEAYDLGIKKREEYKAAKDAYAQLCADKQPAIDALEVKLKELRANISDELFETYKNRVENDLFPPFVPAMANERKEISCGGCGMTQSQKTVAELNSNGYCTCESCRRVIVKTN